jgi:catechol 2,3-dioxygenase-like lactoylglutathione lyase family enzyme
VLGAPARYGLDMSDFLPERVEVIGVDHIYLAVSDMAASEAFYDTVFGLLDFRKIDAPIGGDPHRHYFNKVMQISIRPARGGAHDPYAPGLHHLCLQVADNEAVDRLAGLFAAAGVAATAPARYPHYADDYYALFFSDPDGIRHEIVARRARRKLTVERWNELTSFFNPWAKLKT